MIALKGASSSHSVRLSTVGVSGDRNKEGVAHWLKHSRWLQSPAPRYLHQAGDAYISHVNIVAHAPHAGPIPEYHPTGGSSGHK